jgi:hypothetical protein
MSRFFISQYPTFGSYSNPMPYRVEASPYFFWWLALTANDEYIELCANPSANRFKTNEQIQQVYTDFGDVRYEGSKYVAFGKWWRGKVANGEKRGEFLFAEPKTVQRVELVSDIDAARALINSDDELLIRVSKGMQKKHIENALKRIFDRELSFEKGRQTRNPNRSNARYCLSSPVSTANLKMAFNIYEMTVQAKQNAKKLKNRQIAEAVGLSIDKRSANDEVVDSALDNRALSVAVSRKRKTASDAIANVVEGVFP